MARSGFRWPFRALLAVAVLAIAAGLAWVAMRKGFNPGWVLVAAGAIAAALAIHLMQVSDRLERETNRKQEQLDDLLLQTREQKNAVDAFADGLDVAIFVCDRRATIEYANRLAREMFNIDRPQGKTLLAITLSVDLEQLVLSAASEDEPQQGELSFSYPTDRIALGKAWKHSATPGRIYLSLFDISDLRRLERIRKDFVANVSHELRTPMTIIRANAETMLDDDDPELRQRYLPRIITEVDRLSSITQDLLVLSSAESGPVRKAPCDLADTVRATVSQLTTKADEKDLVLTYDGPKHFVIEANGSQMMQVCLNLIENAIKYTPSGKVHVELIAPAEEDGDGIVTLRVTDTGIGIASDHIGRIFERFYRVDKGRSRQSGGTGLGLAIVKHIVEAHGGQVKVRSALNAGSTFEVTLPVGDVEVFQRHLREG